MNIVYEEWDCRGIWVKVDRSIEKSLCIKPYNGSIIVAFEDSEGKLHESTSYAPSQYMEAFSDFLNRI